jgi:hypothetical protein
MTGSDRSEPGDGPTFGGSAIRGAGCGHLVAAAVALAIALAVAATIAPR